MNVISTTINNLENLTYITDVEITIQLQYQFNFPVPFYLFDNKDINNRMANDLIYFFKNKKFPDVAIKGNYENYKEDELKVILDEIDAVRKIILNESTNNKLEQINISFVFDNDKVETKFLIDNKFSRTYFNQPLSKMEKIIVNWLLECGITIGNALPLPF